jgi:serine/threonine-protein kinase SRPK3
MSEGEKVSGQLLKPIIKYLLLALDFLHRERKSFIRVNQPHPFSIHSFIRSDSSKDIQEDNIMLGVEDDTIFKGFEEEEWTEPSTRKIENDRIICETKTVDIPDNPTHAILCDFGDAQFGEETYIGEVMPDLYRAPEIVLGMPWNEKIDIWSVGLLLREQAPSLSYSLC